MDLFKIKCFLVNLLTYSSKHRAQPAFPKWDTFKR